MQYLKKSDYIKNKFAIYLCENIYIESLLKSTNTKKNTNIYTTTDGNPYYC